MTDLAGDTVSVEEPGTRTVIDATTPGGKVCRVVVCRYGIGRDARVLLSHHGVWEGCAVLTGQAVGELVEALRKAA